MRFGCTSGRAATGGGVLSVVGGACQLKLGQ